MPKKYSKVIAEIVRIEEGEPFYWGCPHPETIYKELGQVIFKLTVHQRNTSRNSRRTCTLLAV
jgi:hypothetical protein